MTRSVWAVILAGGSGTRFWPASRRALPKQFLAIAPGESLIAETRARIAPLVPPERTLVIAGAEHAALVRAALPELPAQNLILEPVGRNTLACVALAAAELSRRDPDSVQVVLPADHVIAPAAAFRAGLRAAIEEACSGSALVTFGVRPTHPATGYGYIELGPALPARAGQAVHDVAGFVEKPDGPRAAAFLAGGKHLWNSGIFVWTTAAIVAALERHAPTLWSALRDLPLDRLGEVYPALEPTPVDKAILERALVRRVLPVDYTWSDVGSWDALSEVLDADAAGNHPTPRTRVVALDASGNVVHAPEGELVALIGVRDLVVVHAGRATLVCSRERAQDVKEIVARLEREAPEWL